MCTFSQYSQYQLATCLTDAYIRQKSNLRHHCRNSAVQCWYQCQLEINDLDNGAVYDNCRCSTDGPTAPNPCPDLNRDCHSPDGTSCTWYRDCLEECCEGTGDGYAIEFAENFCNLYTDNYNTFCPTGRQWIDGVRRCLQVALVPSLRPFIEKSCADIRSDAFRSHSPCYLNPEPGAPSVCSLLSGFDPAVSVEEYVADLLDFDNKGIGWFPLNRQSDKTDSLRQRRQLTEARGGNDSIHVMLLVASLQTLDIPTTGTGRMYSLNEIVTEIADAVRNGQLSKIPVTVDGTEVIVGVSSMGGCGDLLCSSGTNITILATSAAATPHLNMLIVLNLVAGLFVSFAAMW